MDGELTPSRVSVPLHIGTLPFPPYLYPSPFSLLDLNFGVHSSISSVLVVECASLGSIPAVVGVGDDDFLWHLEKIKICRGFPCRDGRGRLSGSKRKS